MTPPESQPHSKVANHNISFDLTKEEKKNMSLTDSDRLVVDEAKRKSEELSSTYLSGSPNITKDLHTEASELTENATEEILDRNVGEPKIIEFYRQELPTLKDMMDEGLDSGDRDERISKKSQYAQTVLKSPLGSRNHTIEKERQHQERETQKSLYCMYETAEFSDETFMNIELLQAPAKHIGRKNIEAFYKVREWVFIVVLLTPDHKQAFAKETNFQEMIRDNKVNFRILHSKPIKPKFNDRRSYVNKEDTVFVTMFLPTLISDAAVKKVFQEFGEVHSVFSGRYKDEEEFSFIRNGKRHIRLTPNGSKQDLPHKVQFHGEQRYFHVMWAEKVVFCKRCSIHHMLKVNCSEVQKEKAVHTKNGITYDTRPILERLSDVHPETIQSAPQVEGTLNSPDVAITHKERPDIE